MAAVTLTLTDICPGGGHYTLTLSGAVTGAKVYDLPEIRALMDTVDKETIAAVILRLAEEGRTNAQLKTLLQAGVTVSI